MKTNPFWKKIKEINFILKNDLTECFNFELKWQSLVFQSTLSYDSPSMETLRIGERNLYQISDGIEIDRD